MIPPRSSRDIIAEFLWRRDFAHTREVWDRQPLAKRRPFEERADGLIGDLRKNGTVFPEDRLRNGGT